MLQNIRDKMQSQKWLTYTILGVIALVFAAWIPSGVADFGFGGAGSAAKVNGEEIPAAEVNQLWLQQQPRLLQAFGGEISEAQRTELQQQLLDDAIRSLATTQYATDLGFRVSPAQLSEAFRAETAFQIDGQFSVDAARARLSAAGMTEAAYVNDLRRSLLVNQLLGSIGISDFLTPAESKRLLGLLDEERELRYLVLPPAAFASTEPLDPAAIEARYTANAEAFTLPESVRLAYAELSLSEVAASLQVGEEQLRQRYDRDQALYLQAETRRPSHILITVDGETDDAAAAARANEISARIKAGGDFAALAREFSKDTQSASNGGQLEWTTREGQLKEFSDRLFAMSEGEISEPVKTQFGYHIIRLDGIRAAAGRSFDDVRAELSATLRNELAIAEFGARQDRLQERLDRAGAQLSELAQEFGMRTGEVENFERGAGGLPLGSDADLNQAVFSDAVVNDKRVGGPAQLGEDRITIFQVVEHRPARLRPLEEVRDDIVAELQRERAVDAALAAAEAAVARLAAGESFDKVAADLRMKAEPARFIARGSPDLPVEIRDAVFAATRPVAGQPQRKALKIEEGAALIEVTSSRVQSLSDNPQLVEMRSERELQRYSRRNVDGYVTEILNSASIRKNPNAFLQ